MESLASCFFSSADQGRVVVRNTFIEVEAFAPRSQRAHLRAHSAPERLETVRGGSLNASSVAKKTDAELVLGSPSTATGSVKTSPSATSTARTSPPCSDADMLAMVLLPPSAVRSVPSTGSLVTREPSAPSSSHSDNEVDDSTVVQPAPRTAMLMCNIPNNYTREMLLALIDGEGFSGEYDFFYLPIDFKSGACLGYAFINFVHPDMVPRFWATFHGFQRWAVPTRKTCKVAWSRPHQGKEALIERYRNSRIMHATVPESCRPLVFKGGERVPFPEPLRTIAAPRARRQREPTRRRGTVASRAGQRTAELPTL